MKMVDENIMIWLDIFDCKKWKKIQEIEGIYELCVQEDKGKILVKVWDWSVWGKKEEIKWYSFCIDFYCFIRVEVFLVGSYKSVVSKSQLQVAYIIKGEQKYWKCVVLYLELAKCCMKGNCIIEQCECYKKEVDICGNLAKIKVGVFRYFFYLYGEI